MTLLEILKEEQIEWYDDSLVHGEITNTME